MNSAKYKVVLTTGTTYVMIISVAATSDGSHVVEGYARHTLKGHRIAIVHQ